MCNDSLVLPPVDGVVHGDVVHLHLGGGQGGVGGLHLPLAQPSQVPQHGLNLDRHQGRLGWFDFFDLPYTYSKIHKTFGLKFLLSDCQIKELGRFLDKVGVAGR